jgi:hypothetical protein
MHRVLDAQQTLIDALDVRRVHVAAELCAALRRL